MGLSGNDWRCWLKGLIGAGISGVSSAVSSGIGASMIAPEKFNLNTELGSTLKLIGITAVVSFIVSISKYLSAKPFPDDLPE